MTFILLIGCRPSTFEESFWSRATPAIRQAVEVSHSYYFPNYSESAFPAPQRILRHVRLLPRDIRVVDSVRTSDSLVALTFDACSTLLPPRADTSIVNFLIRTQTPATFFLGGRWMEAFPDLTLQIAQIPFFEIGNHSYAHGHMNDVSPERQRWEIRYAQDIATMITGSPPIYFRAPYLEADSSVIRRVAAEGLILVAGNLPAGDPDSAMTPHLLIDRMERLSRPGSIIIFHVNRGGRHTATALPGILKTLRRKGLRPVTLSRMLGDPKAFRMGNGAAE